MKLRLLVALAAAALATSIFPGRVVAGEPLQDDPGCIGGFVSAQARGFDNALHGPHLLEIPFPTDGCPAPPQ